MSVRWQVLEAERVVAFTAEGSATLDDWNRAVDEVLARAEEFRGMNVLVDVRGLETVLPSDFFWQLSEKLSGLELTAVRWAMLLTRLVDRGLTHMLAALTSRMPFEVRAFEDRDEALAWLAGGDAPAAGGSEDAPAQDRPEDGDAP